jgi:hypothetical protein
VTVSPGATGGTADGCQPVSGVVGQLDHAIAHLRALLAAMEAGSHFTAENAAALRCALQMLAGAQQSLSAAVRDRRITSGQARAIGNQIAAAARLVQRVQAPLGNVGPARAKRMVRDAIAAATRARTQAARHRL